MLNCLLVRRRIGAYLDGALEGRGARVAQRHLVACADCREEAEALRKMKALLQRGADVHAAPPTHEWAEFWPGVLRGIEVAPRARAGSRPMWLRPRWALGGALVAAVLASFTFWTWQPPVEMPSDDPVVVSSADTEQPGGSVMVYRTPEKDVAVVWVFEVEE